MTTCLVRHTAGGGTFRRRLAVSLFGWLCVWQVFGLDSDKVDFNLQVRPLLSDRCFKCHGPDEQARKGKLRLDTQDDAWKELDNDTAIIKPGHPDKSELIRRILATDEDDLMPPPKSKLKLSSTEKELLKRWVAEGAEYKSHWSFVPVGSVTPPTPQNQKWVRNPIDSFVLSRLEKENLQPAPEASRETLIRRLALDLTGLPPTIAEIDAFLADQSPDAYARVVEKYLASPHYGERMAMDWMDLARYADTYGYQTDVERDLFPWRDWVIRAFNENLPYDQFILWQLAGDLLPNATREQRLATAFNRLHRQTNEGGSIEEEFRTEYVADRVNTVGTAMLGLTFECARCHDHKYDPIKQRDYYSLFAFFNSIDESGLYSHFTRATPTPTLLLWPEEKARAMAQIKLRRALAEERLSDVARESDRAFRKWLKSDDTVQMPRPLARFPFDTVTNSTTPDSVNATNFAKLVDGPKLVAAGILPAVEPGFQPGGKGARDSNRTKTSNAGPGGKMPSSTAGGTPAATNFALKFSGDNELICERVKEFKRTDPFSFSLWLKPTENQDRAVIVHQSRSWTDAGSRGFELVLEKGRPFFGLIHFWPGNAAAVRVKSPLPVNEWSQVVVTYDGSSQAAGIQLYVNGQRAETEVVRDCLTKDIIHREAWGDAEAGKIPLKLAGRFRDNGFKHGLIDDFQVFDECLTELEIKRLARGTPGRSANDTEKTLQLASLSALDGAAAQSAARQYFLSRHYEPYRTALAEVKKLREQENTLINDIPEIMVMDEMPQPRSAFFLKRGAYDAPGEQVQRDTPAAILPFPADQPRNRLGLARWMIDRKNPLTARVVVNRIWRMHFGRGIVTTQENFGSQGRLPSHPELLDWLAGWFMDHGWDVKALHRLIVASATYRQSSQASREVVERDPDNTLLAHGPKHRLLAEQIRDGALAASGLLNPTLGGPSVKPYQPAGLWEESGTGKTYKQDHGDKLYRRSLYTFWRRTAPPPTMLTFDATTREVCTAKRETTGTPLQALVLLNDPQFVEAARVLGEKLLKESPGDLDARIHIAFRSLTGRAPDEKEIAVLRRLFEEQKTFYAKNDNDAKALLATGESKWDKTLPKAEFAATTMLVSAIMNFDEFVMER